MSQLYDAAMAHREWSSSVSNSLSLKIRRDFLLQDALENMQQVIFKQYNERAKFRLMLLKVATCLNSWTFPY